MVALRRSKAAVRSIGLLLAFVGLLALDADRSAEGVARPNPGGSALGRCNRAQPPPPPPRPAVEPTIPAQDGQVVQIVKVTVLPGPFTVDPEVATVRLHRGADGWLVGTLGPITVVDARGSAAGWILVADAEPRTTRGLVRFEPEPPVTIWGIASDVLIGEAGVHKAVLACAPSGGGGGTFEISALVRARHLRGNRVVVRLTLR